MQDLSFKIIFNVFINIISYRIYAVVFDKVFLDCVKKKSCIFDLLYYFFLGNDIKIIIIAVMSDKFKTCNNLGQLSVKLSAFDIVFLKFRNDTGMLFGIYFKKSQQ